jgi:hypothetical protein
LPWKEFFMPLDPFDPRDPRGQEPGGERLRVRLNRVAGEVIDCVVQYETAVDAMAGLTRR